MNWSWQRRGTASSWICSSLTNKTIQENSKQVGWNYLMCSLLCMMDGWERSSDEAARTMLCCLFLCEQSNSQTASWHKKALNLSWTHLSDWLLTCPLISRSQSGAFCSCVYVCVECDDINYKSVCTYTHLYVDRQTHDRQMTDRDR